jgi:hypothetical protein
MPVTAQQQKLLAATARRANRRLERATEGQREYLEYQIRKYHTRTREGGARVFQQGKAGSEAEFKARMRELRLFLGEERDPETGEPIVKTSTRKGWESLKSQQVAAAGETLRGEKNGYTITDAELAALLEEVGHGKKEDKFAKMYAALGNVEAARQAAGRELTEAEVLAAINSRETEMNVVKTLLEQREKMREK